MERAVKLHLTDAAQVGERALFITQAKAHLVGKQLADEIKAQSYKIHAVTKRGQILGYGVILQRGIIDVPVTEQQIN
jgi:hypothetical protein